MKTSTNSTEIPARMTPVLPRRADGRTHRVTVNRSTRRRSLSAVLSAHTVMTLLGVIIALAGAGSAGADQYQAVILPHAGMNEAAAWTGTDTQQVGWATHAAAPLDNQAQLWTNGMSFPTSLHPAGFLRSEARAFNGNQQVGFGFGPAAGTFPPANFQWRALQWTGTAGSVVDLTPPGFSQAYALNVREGFTVGYGVTHVVPQWGSSISYDAQHALLWGSPCCGPVDFNPGDDTYSQINDVENILYVGFYGELEINASVTPVKVTPLPEHACIWQWSSSPVYDLHVSWFPGNVSSRALAIGGNQVVGYTKSDPKDAGNHAVLWTINSWGIATDCIQLTPTGFSCSEAYGVKNGRQAGSGQGPKTNGNLHALVWRSAADRYIDLHLVLDRDFPNQFVQSWANGINAIGDVFGTGLTTAGLRVPVVWRRTPELTGLSIRPASLQGNTGMATGTVTVDIPAPAGGTTIQLSSSNTSIAPVQASITILPNQRSATFPINVHCRLGPGNTLLGGNSQIRAVLGSQSIQAGVSIQP